MWDKLNELVNILKTHVELHKQLLSLEEKKRSAIVKNKTDMVTEITTEEAFVAKSVTENEIIRKELCLAVAGELGLGADSKLTDIIAASSEHGDVSDIKEVHGNLKDVLKKLRYRTKQNSELINRCIRHVEGLFHAIGEARNISPVYSRDGKKNGMSLSMLDQTA